MDGESTSQAYFQGHHLCDGSKLFVAEMVRPLLRLHTEQIKMPITKSLWTMMLESTDDNCQELVKTLIGKSERLKEAAKDPTNLCSVSRRMAALPGLNLVGVGSENETVSKVADEAIKAAREQMENKIL